jgi:hypothetical protein
VGQHAELHYLLILDSETKPSIFGRRQSEFSYPVIVVYPILDYLIFFIFLPKVVQDSENRRIVAGYGGRSRTIKVKLPDHGAQEGTLLMSGGYFPHASERKIRSIVWRSFILPIRAIWAKNAIVLELGTDERGDERDNEHHVGSLGGFSDILYVPKLLSVWRLRRANQVAFGGFISMK